MILVKQRTSYLRRESITSSNENDTVPLLPTQQNQLIHLTGYKLALWTNALLATNGAQAEALIVLQTIDQNLDVGVSDFYSQSASGGVSASRDAIIDLKIFYETLLVLDTTGAYLQGLPVEGPWVECDLELPAVFLHRTMTSTATASYHWSVILEYEYVNRSIAQVIAANVAWGAAKRPQT